MLYVIGEILPLAVVIALSPIPIAATILMLLGPRAGTTGMGFLAGWIVGVVVALVAFSAIATLIPSGPDGYNPWGAAITILVGVAVLFLGVRNWIGQRSPDEQPAMPKWMTSITAITVPRAAALGFILAVANPKNIMLALAAGVAIGASALTLGEEFIAAAVFVGVAAASVAIPVIGYLTTASRMNEPLATVRGWLVDNNAKILSIQSMIIGVVITGAGVGRLR